MILTAEGGCGKTWFCHALQREIQAVDSWVVPLVGALADKDDEDWLAEEVRGLLTRKTGREIAAADLREILREYLARINEGKILLALDGLDELDNESTVLSGLPYPLGLPCGVYVLLTTRPETRRAAREFLDVLTSRGGPVGHIAIDPASEPNKNTVLAFVKARLSRKRQTEPVYLPQEWAAPIVELAGRRFLYAAHYCEVLHWGAYTDIAHLPPPDKYYPRFFDHVCQRVGQCLFEKAYRPILAAIAAFGVSRRSTSESLGAYSTAPISRSYLRALGFSENTLIEVLSDFAHFLTCHRDERYPEPGYGLASPMLSSYLLSDSEWRVAIGDALARLVKLALKTFSPHWSDVGPEDPFSVRLYLLFVEQQVNPKNLALLSQDEKLKFLGDPFFCCAGLRIVDHEETIPRSLFGSLVGIFDFRILHCLLTAPVAEAFFSLFKEQPEDFVDDPILGGLRQFECKDLTPDHWAAVHIRLHREPHMVVCHIGLAAQAIGHARIAREKEKYSDALQCLAVAAGTLGDLTRRAYPQQQPPTGMRATSKETGREDSGTSQKQAAPSGAAGREAEQDAKRSLFRRLWDHATGLLRGATGFRHKSDGLAEWPREYFARPLYIDGERRCYAMVDASCSEAWSLYECMPHSLTLAKVMVECADLAAMYVESCVTPGQNAYEDVLSIYGLYRDGAAILIEQAAIAEAWEAIAKGVILLEHSRHSTPSYRDSAVLMRQWMERSDPENRQRVLRMIIVG